MPQREVSTELVACTTTARFEPVGPGTRLTAEFEYGVRGGPIGRFLEGTADNAIVTRFGEDLANLKAVAERWAPTGGGA